MAYATPELTLLGRASGIVLGTTLPPLVLDSDPNCPAPITARVTPCKPLGEW